MVNKIGSESALVREAMRAAMRYLPEASSMAPGGLPGSGATGAVGATGASSPDRVGDGLRLPRPSRSGGSDGPDFVQALNDGLQAVDAKVRGADSIPQDLITGKIDDFHEIAVQIKDAELSFRFAMEIRNKLIDAYREIMRMNV